MWKVETRKARVGDQLIHKGKHFREILLKGAQSRFAHIEKFILNFSNSSFVIRVNLLHP